MDLEYKNLLLKGMPASIGKVRGKVKVIKSVQDADKMTNGDILVAIFTSPLLTIAILRASAIITDKGGMMCHAAIIAREMGIPCVTGTEKATKILSDGMEVIVDGAHGFVCQ